MEIDLNIDKFIDNQIQGNYKGSCTKYLKSLFQAKNGGWKKDSLWLLGTLKISVMFKNEHQVDDPLNRNHTVLEITLGQDGMHQPVTELKKV